MATPNIAGKPGFDARVAGRRAECDGGGPIAGTRFAGRQEFTGTVSGEYVDHGDPPWRWYLMVDLVRKPEGWEADSVWCESSSLFFLDER
ncbi:MAG: hypothetical protein ACE5E4_09720 [Candidatus Binatia bacterium]